MSGWRIHVWTKLAVPPDALWTALATPQLLRASMPRGVRWVPESPDTLAQAWDEAIPGEHPGAMVVATRPFPWVVTVERSIAGLGLNMTIQTPLFQELSHRRRLERTLGDQTRLTDEVVFHGAAGGIRPFAIRRFLLGAHRHVAHVLSHEIATPRSQILALHPGNEAHGIDLFSSLDELKPR